MPIKDTSAGSLTKPSPRRYDRRTMAQSLVQQPHVDPNTQDFLEQAAGSKFDFHQVSVKAAGDERLKAAINNAVMRQYTGRQLRMLDLPDPDGLRALAGDIKQHTLDHLDYYLEQFTTNVRKNGGHVHFARDGAEAKRIIVDIAARANVTRCIKSKSMVSEEIELVHALEQAGLDVVETDLGEFIVQISHDKPSHLVAPIVHKDRASIAKLFSEYFGTPYDDDPHALTMQARKYRRDKFRSADSGMTGGTVLAAETGQPGCVALAGDPR